MHRIDKFLTKLDAGRREKILATLLLIQSGNIKNLDIKKIKGEVSHYRVRIGQCRIKFEMTQSVINIIDIDFKNDNTYSR